METGIFEHQRSLMPLVLLYEFCGSALITYSFSLGSQEYAVRAIALMMGWIIASTVSGAHFNPAVSLAVYLYQRKFRQWPCLVYMMIAQLFGCFAGVFIAYLLGKYNEVDLYPNNMITDGYGGQSIYFADNDHNPYFARLLLNESLLTFTFVFIVLIVKYKKSLVRVTNPIKGIAITLAIFCCYSMSNGAGACFNPWFGLAETFLFFGKISDNNKNISRYADVFWVYMVGPFIGGACAGLFTIFHHKIESLGIEVPLSESIVEFRH